MNELNPNAYAMRVVRARESGFVVYTGVTFPAGPFTGVNLYLRRCEAFGYLVEESKGKTIGFTIDILDKDGDIIQDYPLSFKGFEYLRRTLKFTVEMR